MTPSPTWHGPAVDVHCHVFPEAFIAAARRPGNPYNASVERRADGREFLVSRGYFDYPLTPELYDLDALLEDMAERGITAVAQSLAPPALAYWSTERGAARDWAQLVNDSIAERVRRYPDRFAGVAHVPLQDVQAAIEELGRASDRLGFRAVQIASNVGGTNLDDPSLFPFFEACARLDVSVFVHPYLPFGGDRLQRYYLHNLVGMVSETGLAIASVIFGRVLERLPSLRLCFAHAGGTYPYIRGRLDHGHRVRPECGDLAEPPGAYVRRLWFDTIAFEPSALRFLVESAGADRVMLGSDYPFDMGPAQPVAEVLATPGLDQPQLERILWRNAAGFFGFRSGPAAAAPSSQERMHA